MKHSHATEAEVRITRGEKRNQSYPFATMELDSIL